MEVHTPHEPVTSLRGLVTHLSLVIVGVLIALSFEGIATWREHRALVRDARANLLNEVRDNRNALAERLRQIPQETDQLIRALEVSIALQQHKTIDGKMDLGFKSADLQTASHTTAEVDGPTNIKRFDLEPPAESRRDLDTVVVRGMPKRKQVARVEPPKQAPADRKFQHTAEIDHPGGGPRQRCPPRCLIQDLYGPSIAVGANSQLEKSAHAIAAPADLGADEPLHHLAAIRL